MSDLVIAALIAASATITASFMQLRAALAREIAGRAPPPPSRRKSRVPFVIVAFVLAAGAAGGFALSQWLTEQERIMQAEIRHALEARINEMARTETQLQQSRADARAEIEAGVLRRLGLEGVVVVATVGPCRPPLVLSTPALAPQAGTNAAAMPSGTALPSPPASTCSEHEASPVTLCATIPANAKVADVELFVRAADSDTPWETARVMPGIEVDKARFGEKPEEISDGSATKQVCERFVHWSAERARVARMLVRYTL
ncbi:MAG: hypothetical protein IRZ28_09880 [Steroidobacteraceae bacterium]|nr:hypothetical protein [Steroidobacteraceae bacterium]